MQSTQNEIIEIIEGDTKILVPKESVNEKVPPKQPIFFNPRAKLNRDFSIIAYTAFLKNFNYPKIFLDGLSGIGARGLRAANEVKGIEKVIVNDLNPSALELATRSASLNKLKNFEISENEVCRFFSLYSKKGIRASIVDVDPFGSPSKFIDCAIRATMHGGLFSSTATDLQVLHGLFPQACKRRYYGIPIKTEYGNEIAIRLILGCIAFVASRFDIQIIPLFVENEMHYYRTYMRILKRADQEENLGYIIHCTSCGNRQVSLLTKNECELCKSKNRIAGPLWIGALFEKKFVKSMLENSTQLTVEKKCEKILEKCLLEAEMPATYFTLDEIASKMQSAPISMNNAISKLQKNGFDSSPTSLNNTGFRTNAKINQILKVFSNQ